MDIRKFEIELYWKRATYFWAFIAASFAAYALTYETASDHEPWLAVVFSALGLVFSFAWYLVNRGSKFWQNNWERHVDLLEDMTLGPLYKVIAEEPSTTNLLVAPGPFSVSKINQILSLFITLVWAVLLFCSILPLSFKLPLEPFKLAIAVLALAFIILMLYYGKSSNRETNARLRERRMNIEP